MVPAEDEVKVLWDKYHLPKEKIIHVTLVAKVAIYLTSKLTYASSADKQLHVNIDLLRAAALLHDIDKSVPPLPGERHPDTGVRLLREEGMSDVADVVAKHSLHNILDSSTAPKTWEEKLLFLADKMVKYDIVGVDGRFALWNNEHLPQAAQTELDESYPMVKRLEKEVFDMIGMNPRDLPHRIESGNE